MVSLRMSSSEIELAGCSWMPTKRLVEETGVSLPVVMVVNDVDRRWRWMISLMDDDFDDIRGANPDADDTTQKARNVDRRSFIINNTRRYIYFDGIDICRELIFAATLLSLLFVY